MNKFDVLGFIADNAGLDLPEALIKAYKKGQDDYKEKIDEMIEEIESRLDALNITLTL